MIPRFSPQTYTSSFPGWEVLVVLAFPEGRCARALLKQCFRLMKALDEAGWVNHYELCRLHVVASFWVRVSSATEFAASTHMTSCERNHLFNAHGHCFALYLSAKSIMDLTLLIVPDPVRCRFITLARGLLQRTPHCPCRTHSSRVYR